MKQSRLVILIGKERRSNWRCNWVALSGMVFDRVFALKILLTVIESGKPPGLGTTEYQKSIGQNRTKSDISTANRLYVSY